MGGADFSKRGYSFLPRNKYLAAVAVAALCLSLVELVDVVNLPFESSIGHAVASGSLFSSGVLNSLLDTGYTGLFILMAMESAALPIPSELVLPLAGYAVYLGKMNLTLAIIDATIAGLVGAVIDYYLALLLGRLVIYRAMGKMGVSQEQLDTGERWMDSKGAWTVFIARLLPGLRSIISIPAGLLKMNVRMFVVLTTLGAFIWSAVLIYVGYSGGPLWQSGLSSLSTFATQAILAAVAGLSILYVVYYLGAFGRRG